MPQIYINHIDNGFLVLWHTVEGLVRVKEEALKNRVVFPRGWNTWKNETRKSQALRARILCRQMLDEPDIWYEQNGKPFLPCGRLSISHSQHYLAVAYHPRCEIGVDVEEPHERIHKITSRFLTAGEKSWAVQTDVCTAVWCAKEAVFKKFGGRTAFYSENIELEPFTLLKPEQNIAANVQAETGTIHQNLLLKKEDCCILAFTL